MGTESGRRIPKAFRPYLVTGFVLHGWLFFFPGIVRLPDPGVKKWGAVIIPRKQLRLCYLGLELKRRLSQWLKGWNRR